MTQDHLFRLMVIGIFASFAPMALYHRVRSHSKEPIDRRQEGAVMLFGLRLGALPGLLGSLAWMINPQWMAWSSVTTPIGMRWLGLCLLGLSGMLVVWTFRSLGDNLTDSVVIRKSHTLVVTGPYRFVRHPFYVAFLIAVIGGSLATTNWFLLLAGMVPFGFLVVRTRIEEKKLVERFGDDYRMYQEQTGQFFPRWPRATSLV